jgi:hypothetical protein
VRRDRRVASRFPQAILLDGWGAKPPGQPEAHGFGQTGLWLWIHDELQGWRDHEPYLRQLAQSWGWKPEYRIRPANEYGLRFVDHGGRGDGPYFYAEALNLAGPQRAR